MKKLRQFYTHPLFFASLLALLLIWYFLPVDLYFTAILIVFIPLIVLTLGLHIVTNRRIQLIRNQLYQIFQTLEEFDIDIPQKMNFMESPFPIFNELNEYLVELIERIRHNYLSNKQFTQNASHELQTPLAIIKGNAEMLLQSPNFKEKEIEALAIILQNTNRLSKLNSTLILLSKIEHHRFPDAEQVSFIQKTDEILNHFKDLIRMQKLVVEKNYEKDFVIEMSSTLAEILITNLIQNAIRHNQGDNINITIGNHYFQTMNKGKKLKTTPESLFNRFKRVSNNEESLGLGLSIVKRICTLYNLEVSYTIGKDMHVLKVMKL